MFPPPLLPLPEGGEKAGKLPSSERLQPVRETSSEGHWTWVKVKFGLSAFLNQSNRNSQPGLRALGKEEHWPRSEIPPYVAPGSPPNWGLQPSKRPTPPPGMLRSKWLLPRSPPVLVDWTTIVLPATGPEVNVRLRKVTKLVSYPCWQAAESNRLTHSKHSTMMPRYLR